jgi:long-chain fatty acid transport protein
MSLFRLTLVAVCAFWTGFITPNALAADNGVFKLEIADAVAAGLGGAFAGQADRPSAVYYNPAGIVQMNTIEASATFTWLQPQIRYNSSDAANNGAGYTANMKEDNYYFPTEFISIPLIKDKLYVGIGESSDFGAGNDWEANSFTRYSTVKDSLENQDYRLVAAYKVTNQWSLAVAAVDDQSKFEHDQAINQGAAPTGDGDTLFKANDNVWGFNVATMFKLNEQNQFGLVYKSPLAHRYKGKEYFNNLYTGPGGLGGLLGGASLSTKAIQKITLPQSVTLGYSLKPNNKWTINFDLEWTDWARYKTQTTFYPDLTAAQAGALPGPQLRGWKSVWSESVGVQYAVTDKLRVRGGYAHHQTPVPKSTVNTEFADNDSNAVTAGFGYDLTNNLSLDIAYIAAFYQARNVSNTIDNSLGAFMNGKYSEFVNIGTMSLTYKF